MAAVRALWGIEPLDARQDDGVVTEEVGGAAGDEEGTAEVDGGGILWSSLMGRRGAAR